MAALLAADAAAVFRHILIHILVAHGGLGVVDALLIKSLYRPKLDMTVVTTVLVISLPRSFI